MSAEHTPHSEPISFRDLDTPTLAKMVYCAVDTPSSVLAERVAGLLEQLESGAIPRPEDTLPSQALPAAGFKDWREEAEWWQKTCEYWRQRALGEASTPASRSSDG